MNKKILVTITIVSTGIFIGTNQTIKNLETFLNAAEKESTIKTASRKTEIKGMASWYGQGFQGKPTASGEKYNQNAFTAAHPSLKFGTRVKVTNLNNGRSVIVRINDRGPYSKGRIIDLSHGAANAIGMIKMGIAPVKIEILKR